MSLPIVALPLNELNILKTGQTYLFLHGLVGRARQRPLAVVEHLSDRPRRHLGVEPLVVEDDLTAQNLGLSRSHQVMWELGKLAQIVTVNCK